MAGWVWFTALIGASRVAEVSQCPDVVSIPIARSISLDDAIALTPLTC